MRNKIIIGLDFRVHDIENYQGLGLCYSPQPSADNTNLAALIILDITLNLIQ
jgi:hypothetical protein